MILGTVLVPSSTDCVGDLLWENYRFKVLSCGDYFPKLVYIFDYLIP